MARLNRLDVDKIVRDTNRDLAKGAKRYLKKEGQAKVKKMMSETIDEKVYNRYTPKVYKRRGSERYGLKDVRKMEDKVILDTKSGKTEIGHLEIVNQAKRVPLSKKKYSYVNNFEDFLYMIKDEGQVYDFTKGHSSTYEEWGNGGRPLHLNKALDKKVQNSKELRGELKRAALKNANEEKNKRKS